MVRDSTKTSQIRVALLRLIAHSMRCSESRHDCLGLAFLYHFLQVNNACSDELASLAPWARAFCYEKLVEGKLSRRKDVEITAAILCAASLESDRGFPLEKKAKLRETLPNLLDREIGDDNLFFGNATYTAIVLYSLSCLNITFVRLNDVLTKCVEKYKGDVPTRLIGISILTRALVRMGMQPECQQVVDLAKAHLGDQGVDEQERIYILSCLWSFYEAYQRDQLLDIEPEVKASLRNLVEKRIPPGESAYFLESSKTGWEGTLSPLCISLSFDLLERYYRELQKIKERMLDRKYSANFGLRWCALWGMWQVALIPAGSFFVYFWWINPMLYDAYRFWFMGDTQISSTTIGLGTLLLLINFYLFLAGAVSIGPIFISVIPRKIISDLRIWDNIKPVQIRLLKWYWVALVFFLVRTLFSAALRSRLGIGS